jgi:hypothetical protein
MGEKREEEGKKKKLPYKIRRRLFFIKINRLHENPSKISRGINSRKKRRRKTNDKISKKTVF